MDMFIAMSVVMVTWAYAYIQAHQTVYINYVWVFLYQLYLNKSERKLF